MSKSCALYKQPNCINANQVIHMKTLCTFESSNEVFSPVYMGASTEESINACLDGWQVDIVAQREYGAE